MFLFTLGLAGALVPIGSAAGAALPTAASERSFIEGVAIICTLGFLIGVGTSIAEPALMSLGETVERLTNGGLRKCTLIVAVTFGVAAGTALGFIRIYFTLPLWWILLTGYSACLLLTLCNDDVVTCVAWDSVGITTGPIVVPIV